MGGIGAQVEHDLMKLGGVGDGDASVLQISRSMEILVGSGCTHQLERFVQ
jgi:hypothetical protein